MFMHLLYHMFMQTKIVEFLDWTPHVSKMIQSVSSLTYAFRILNKNLNRCQFKQIIHSFFISRMSYGCQIWSGNLTKTCKNRIDSCFFRMLRLLNYDFKGRESRQNLVENSNMRSPRSLFIIRDMQLLHKLCTKLATEPLISKLISRAHYNERRPNRLLFFDHSQRKIGRNNFINRARYVAELIPCEWTHMNEISFNRMIKNLVLCILTRFSE